MAATAENRGGPVLPEKVQPCAAPAAGGSRQGEDALVTRDELAAAHEAHVPPESRKHVAGPFFSSGRGWTSLAEKHLLDLPGGKYGQEIHDDRLPLHLRQDRLVKGLHLPRIEALRSGNTLDLGITRCSLCLTQVVPVH